MIATDYPDSTGILQDTSAGAQPILGERIIGSEVTESIPVVVNCIDTGHIRPPQLLLKLQIVGRIGENEVNAVLWKPTEDLDAIPSDDLI
jgi:hypothetical protein